MGLFQSMNVIFGVALIFPSGTFIMTYIPVLVVFFWDQEFRKSPAYVIMAHIGITDVLQLSIHLYSGFVVLFDINVPREVEKAIGAIMTGLWWSMLTFHLFLNINRLTSTLIAVKYPRFNMKYMNVVFYILSYSAFIAPFILKLLPRNNYIFDAESFAWIVPKEGEMPFSNDMRSFSQYLVLVVLLFNLANYGAFFYTIVFMHNVKPSRRELKITIQVSVVSAYFIFSFVYWHCVGGLLGDAPIFNYASNLIWIVLNGINPFIYFIFNKRLRTALKCLFTEGSMLKNSSMLKQKSHVMVTRMG